MACVRPRRGAWVLDYRRHGRRVVTTFRTKRLAEAALVTLRSRRTRRLHPAVDPLVTIRDYASRFLADCAEAEVALRTLETYRAVLANHILPRIGGLKVAVATRADVRGLLLGLRQDAVSVQGQKGTTRQGRRPLSASSIRQHRAILSALFDSAIRDELREDNPAHHVFRKARTKAAKAKTRPRVGGAVRAMTAQERDLFLGVAMRVAPEWYTAWALMALAGLRRNEALGLRWESVRLGSGQIRVHEQLGERSTKSGDERMVDLADPLAQHLRELRSRRRALAFGLGRAFDERERVCAPKIPLEPTRTQVGSAVQRPARAMRRVLKQAELPRHFTMHSLRHSFCSLLISSGISPVYVQQQAGHADVGFTVRVYGSWFPASAPGAMNRLCAGVPGLLRGKAVTKTAETGNIALQASPQTLDPTGTTPRPGGRGPRTP
jgi:integrase